MLFVVAAILAVSVLALSLLALGVYLWLSTTRKKKPKTVLKQAAAPALGKLKQPQAAKASEGRDKIDSPLLIKFVAGLILALLGIYAVVVAYKSIFTAKGTGSIETATTITSFGQQVSLERAMRAICEAESGCRQYEYDGVTPFRNREESTASGKYGIVGSLHEGEARIMGHDIHTEEGNEAYARYRLIRYGTKDWESDYRSVSKWAPMIVDRYEFTFEAPVEKFTDPIPVPDRFKLTTDGTEDPFIARDNRGREARFDRAAGLDEDLSSPVDSLAFKALGNRPSKITIRFWRVN